jgi:hypothetical protein
MSFGPMGELRYSGERVRCHLCGRWLKMVGGSHLMTAHGITTGEYREMFRLPVGASTAAPFTSELKRDTMLEQIASGDRAQPTSGAAVPPTILRWQSLGVRQPDLLREWDSEANAKLDPYGIGPHAKAKVWWRCEECGHRWQQSPKQRSQGRGCPACGKRRSIAATIERNGQPVAPERLLVVQFPDVAQEWDMESNAGVDLATVAAHSDLKAWWRCCECEHVWRAAVNDRTRRGGPKGCPRC